MSTNAPECRCAYPQCKCQDVETRCVIDPFAGLPATCVSSHRFLVSTACSGKKRNQNFGLGVNRLSSLEPYATSGCGCDVYIVFPACKLLRFHYNHETETYEGEAGYTLVYRNNLFTLVNDAGERWFFHGFEPEEPHHGQLIKGPAANGSRNSLEAFDPDNPAGDPYTTDHRLKGLRVVETVNGVQITYAYVFEYNADSNMTAATAKRKEDNGAWENLRRALFTYYNTSSGSSSSSGGSGGAIVGGQDDDCRACV